MQKLAIVALNSLLAAGLYATMSYGLAVIYGVMRIINLAHAGLMMLAAYATWALNDRFGLDPFLSMVVVAPAFFLLGMALYATRHPLAPAIVRGPSMQSLLLLFGVWLVLQNLAYAIWGGDTQSILTPYTMESVQILGGRFGVPQIRVFVVSILSLVGLNLVLRRTFLGKAIRAVTQNRDAAMLSGGERGSDRGGRLRHRHRLRGDGREHALHPLRLHARLRPELPPQGLLHHRARGHGELHRGGGGRAGPGVHRELRLGLHLDPGLVPGRDQLHPPGGGAGGGAGGLPGLWRLLDRRVVAR